MSYPNGHVLFSHHFQTMETFAPGDLVVAIHTDVSASVYSTILKPARILPDSPLRENTVYHVEGIKYTSDGNQGLFITGLRVFVGKHHIPWSSCRFRKVDSLSGHSPSKSRRRLWTAPRQVGAAF
jgi:hypothetical protein